MKSLAAALAASSFSTLPVKAPPYVFEMVCTVSVSELA